MGSPQECIMSNLGSSSFLTCFVQKYLSWKLTLPKLDLSQGQGGKIVQMHMKMWKPPDRRFICPRRVGAGFRPSAALGATGVANVLTGPTALGHL